jgi:hypothetical protein
MEDIFEGTALNKYIVFRIEELKHILSRDKEIRTYYEVRGLLRELDMFVSHKITLEEALPRICNPRSYMNSRKHLARNRIASKGKKKQRIHKNRRIPIKSNRV